MARILVVDRTLSVREALTLVLELEGHTVRQAEHGRQALALIEAGTFDVVIADAQMHDLPFASFCTALRLAAPHIRVVVMSLDITDGPAVAPCAPAAFLPKPFPAPVLFEAVAA